MEAQSDYIKDFQRRLQSEYQKAGLLAIPEMHATGGGGDVLGLFGSGAGDKSNLGLGGYPAKGVTRTPSCPLLDTPKAPSPEGSADEGAGGNSAVRRFFSVDESRRPAVSFAAYHSDVVAPPCATKPIVAPVVSPVLPCVSEADTESSVAEVAKEVVRLRLLKKQHDELSGALARSEAQLRRLSPCAILQFYSYLERHLGDAGLASTVPEALLKLVQCLCAVCGVAVSSHTPEGILNSVRMLLREPHSFTSKLCNMPHVSGDEAQGLAPFLLSEVQFKRVRDKEVNACYEAFHAWLSAFYFFSVISDQVSPTAQELERQEVLLKKLNGQEELLSRSKSAPALSPRSKAQAAPRVEAPHGARSRPSAEASKGRAGLTNRRSSRGDDDERAGGHGAHGGGSGHISPAPPPPRASSSMHRAGSASPSVPRSSASPSVPRGNTGVTRRTNAPLPTALQPSRRSAAPAGGSGASASVAGASASVAGAGAGGTQPHRRQSDSLVSGMRSSKRDLVAPTSPVLQSRSARPSHPSSLGVGSPLPVVPERQPLDTSAPSVYRRSTAPPLRPGCSM